MSGLPQTNHLLEPIVLYGDHRSLGLSKDINLSFDYLNIRDQLRRRYTESEKLKNLNDQMAKLKTADEQIKNLRAQLAKQEEEKISIPKKPASINPIESSNDESLADKQLTQQSEENAPLTHENIELTAQKNYADFEEANKETDRSMAELNQVNDKTSEDKIAKLNDTIKLLEIQKEYTILYIQQLKENRENKIALLEADNDQMTKLKTADEKIKNLHAQLAKQEEEKTSIIKETASINPIESSNDESLDDKQLTQQSKENAPLTYEDIEEANEEIGRLMVLLNGVSDNCKTPENKIIRLNYIIKLLVRQKECAISYIELLKKDCETWEKNYETKIASLEAENELLKEGLSIPEDSEDIGDILNSDTYDEGSISHVEKVPLGDNTEEFS